MGLNSATEYLHDKDMCSLYPHFHLTSCPTTITISEVMSVVSEFPVIQRLLAQNVGLSEAVSESHPDFSPNLAKTKQTREVHRVIYRRMLLVDVRGIRLVD
jgi:hypothetical protein